jgi:hypothetical protein
MWKREIRKITLAALALACAACVTAPHDLSRIPAGVSPALDCWVDAERQEPMQSVGLNLLTYPSDERGDRTKFSELKEDGSLKGQHFKINLSRLALSNGHDAEMKFSLGRDLEKTGALGIRKKAPVSVMVVFQRIHVGGGNSYFDVLFENTVPIKARARLHVAFPPENSFQLTVSDPKHDTVQSVLSCTPVEWKTEAGAVKGNSEL